jgi:hypothetical protein
MPELFGGNLKKQELLICMEAMFWDIVNKG